MDTSADRHFGLRAIVGLAVAAAVAISTTCTANHVTPVDSSVPSFATLTTSPTPDLTATLSHACGIYRDFVTYAQHDISNGTDLQKANRLTRYADALKEDGQTLRDAGADQVDPILKVADPINGLKTLILAFGVDDPKTTRALRIVLNVGSGLMAFCPT